jgi:heat shock protein HtpX
LRKIENRGELHGATSAIMEMCIDNPREGFADIFATHPSVDARVEALVKFAGGHDPGPLALAPPPEQEQTPAGPATPASGPWGHAPADAGGGDKPFLPPPPLGSEPSPPQPEPGPWGPHRGN